MVGRVYEHELIDSADAVLTEAGWNTKEIDRIACNVGPGGFTSVRSGVACANALADQLDIPIAGYHGSTLIIARAAGEVQQTAPVRHHSAEIFWIHSTRRDQVFVRGGPWPEPTVVALVDVLAEVKDAAVAGDLLESHRNALAAQGASFPPMCALDMVLPTFLNDLSYETTMLVPWYGRGI